MGKSDDQPSEDATDPGREGPNFGPLAPTGETYPVVGVGASAGGLDALQSLLSNLPAEPGVAIIYVHHGDPDEKSRLVEILERSSPMPVVAITDGMQLQENRLHVCPTGQTPEIEDGRFRLLSIEHENITHAIDRFFRSLSDTHRSRAVGVVLSGNLHDGTEGLEAIQQRGGITIAQDPATAKNPGMPSSAESSGSADLVLSPEGIAEELVGLHKRWSTHEDDAEIPDDALGRIFGYVREETGVDFTHYKRTTLARRVHRRMIANRVETVEAYLDILAENPEEARELQDESLINVTSFFREPDTYEALQEHVFPELVERRNRGRDRPVRVWVPGCATGEEAYSIAIAFFDAMQRLGDTPQLQVFGTDISDAAIDIAREGRYSPSITDDVSEERLRAYFTEEGGHYRINETIRNCCVFAHQDLLQERPFSEIDLVSCRNVLIYFEPEPQTDIAETLHYALVDDGFLVLGSSESSERFPNLFDRADFGKNVYRKMETAHPRFPQTPSTPHSMQNIRQQPGGRHPEGPDTDPGSAIDEAMLDLYAPPGVVLDEGLEILEFRGDANQYLEPEQGQASLDLMRIAPQGIAVAIRSAVQEVSEGDAKDGVRVDSVRFRIGDEPREVSLRVIEVPGAAGPATYLVTFEDENEARRSKPKGFTGALADVARDVSRALRSSQDPERVEHLEAELESTRQYLQSLIEEYEATNEELRSANEEALSTNEELQSTNEELETAKEELQSTNEELTTVNDELRDRNEEIEQINNDLVNFINSVDLPIVMLGPDLRIRRFTPKAENLLGLIDGDIGRPLQDLRLPFPEDDLEDAILEVLDTLRVERTEVETDEGAVHELRIHPYRTEDNRIDGAVLVFWDVGDEEGS